MSAHKRRRMDPVQAIKGLPGWKVQTNPEDVLNATNKSSLTNGIGPIAQLKLQIREVHDLPEYFLLGAIVLQTCPAPIQHVNVVLNTTTQENIIPWLTVKTARKLLGVGAIVSVDGTVVNDNSTSTGTVESPPNTSTIVASTLNLTGVVLAISRFWHVCFMFAQRIDRMKICFRPCWSCCESTHSQLFNL